MNSMRLNSMDELHAPQLHGYIDRHSCFVGWLQLLHAWR
jgi:hypothetical protein